MNRQYTHITLPHQDMYQNLTRECGIFCPRGQRRVIVHHYAAMI